MIVEDSKGKKHDIGEGSIIFHCGENVFYKTITDRLEDALKDAFNKYAALHPGKVITRAPRTLQKQE
jgi:hypothetical protein